MDYPEQREHYATEGYAVFERVLAGPMLDLLRAECATVIAREDARLDAMGVEVDGISHRGKRYFAGECQRAQPGLRDMLFSETMADICRATLGPDAYFFYDQYVVKGASQGMPFAWHQDSGYVVGNGGPPGHKPYLTCWCTLDDTTIANGTVRILPFSQVAGDSRRYRRPCAPAGNQRPCRLDRRRAGRDDRGAGRQHRRVFLAGAARDGGEHHRPDAPGISGAIFTRADPKS